MAEDIAALVTRVPGGYVFRRTVEVASVVICWECAACGWSGRFVVCADRTRWSSECMLCGAEHSRQTVELPDAPLDQRPRPLPQSGYVERVVSRDDSEPRHG